MTRRRYGAEGNADKSGTSDLDLSRLAVRLTLRWQCFGIVMGT